MTQSRVPLWQLVFGLVASVVPDHDDIEHDDKRHENNQRGDWHIEEINIVHFFESHQLLSKWFENPFVCKKLSYCKYDERQYSDYSPITSLYESACDTAVRHHGTDSKDEASYWHCD